MVQVVRKRAALHGDAVRDPLQDLAHLYDIKRMDESNTALSSELRQLQNRPAGAEILQSERDIPLCNSMPMVREYLERDIQEGRQSQAVRMGPPVNRFWIR